MASSAVTTADPGAGLPGFSIEWKDRQRGQVQRLSCSRDVPRPCRVSGPRRRTARIAIARLCGIADARNADAAGGDAPGRPVVFRDPLCSRSRSRSRYPPCSRRPSCPLCHWGRKSRECCHPDWPPSATPTGRRCRRLPRCFPCRRARTGIPALTRRPRRDNRRRKGRSRRLLLVAQESRRPQLLHRHPGPRYFPAALRPDQRRRRRQARRSSATAGTIRRVANIAAAEHASEQESLGDSSPHLATSIAARHRGSASNSVASYDL